MSSRLPLLDPEVYYQCDRCTACCRWPGDVKVSDEEISEIATFLDLDEEVFLERYTRLRTNRNGLSLIENADHSCVMLENGGCRINPVKPQQCRDFPNHWNFPGWRSVCQAKAIPLTKAQREGLV